MRGTRLWRPEDPRAPGHCAGLDHPFRRVDVADDHGRLRPAPHIPIRYVPCFLLRTWHTYQYGTAGRRAVIWGVGRPLSRPGMAYCMVACSVYLYIAILGVNVRK
jgi:hypothetical protein